VRRTITFTDRQGRFAGKVTVREGGGRGNRHFNVRRPDGPPCPEPGCGAPFAPVCPNTSCEGYRVPRNVMRVERGWEPRERRAPKGGGR
jgi:hypothetical protein